MKTHPGRSAALVVAGVLALAGAAAAQLPAEPIGRVEVLPATLGPHWVWASDPLLERIALVDLDRGEMLGMINGGWGITTGVFPSSRPEVYLPETHYSRGSRGVRTDVVTFYDARTLAPTGEVVLPPKRANNVLPSANTALSDDDRFLAIFNMTPATSLSIVDVEHRRFTSEISTPGCALAFAAGSRRFATLCGDGALLLITLDDAGHPTSKRRTAPFFDPIADPVTEKAVRWRDSWVFVSFGGEVYRVDFSGEEPTFEAPWSLLDGVDPEESWQIGGMQHLAIHEPTGRLYSLMHRGGADTHKQAGTEVWIHDLASHERVQRIDLRGPGLTVMGVPLAFGEDWLWPFDGLYGWLVDTLTTYVGVGEIAVTPDDRPLLVTAADYSGSLGVYDALSGELLRRVISGNFATVALQAPWNGMRAEE